MAGFSNVSPTQLISFLKEKTVNNQDEKLIPFRASINLVKSVDY